MESAQSEENGMEPMLVHVFITDIGEQAAMALGAARGVNAALERMSDPDGQTRLWFGIRAFLTAAANISKALWPNPGRKTANEFPDRGRILRDRLGVADDSPLANRDLRNHFEHLDERLEEWWLQDATHNIVRRVVGPPNAVEGLDEGSKFEHFDPSTGRVTFRGDVYELQPLLASIEDIKGRADVITAKPWWMDEQEKSAG